MNPVLRLGGLATLAVLLAPGVAHAVVNWSNPSGSTPLFTWHTGYSNNGYFGDPVIVGNTFVFTPPAFTAFNPGQNTRSDTLQVDILAQPGQTITGIIIREFGTRSTVSGTSVQSTMFIKDLTDITFPQYQDAMVFSNDTTQTPVAWSGIASRDGLTLTNLQLSLTNNLTAFLSGRTITKNRVEIEILPTPGALGVLAGAGLLAARRRRR